MVRNRKSNDIDFVQPTKYPKLPRGFARKPPPEPKPLPHFDPLPIINENTYSTPKLLTYINPYNPY
jgi:hypothetical protein